MSNFSLAKGIKNYNANSCLTKFQYYLFYFFTFSFLGWSLETVYSYIVLGHFINRGFFFGPICPIYGFGALMLILFLNKYKTKPIKLFLHSILIFSIFEYAISYGLEALYNLCLWDYANDFLNLNGRISMFYSVAWGFIALVFTYVIYPLFTKFMNFLSSKFPLKLKLFLLRLLVIIFIIDALYTFIEYSH